MEENVDKTRKIVGYDANNKAIWVKYVNQDYWFLKSFERILTEELKLILNKENTKQLQELYEGDKNSGSFWDLSTLCLNRTDHDFCINAHLLVPDLPIGLLKTFIDKFSNIPGSAFKQLLSGFDIHRNLDNVKYEVVDTSKFTALIDKKIEENKNKIIVMPDQEKATNWLIGQIMKEIKDRSKVNIQELKATIQDKLKPK